MYSHDMRYIIIYNGEVYNFKELKSQFSIDSQTTCDTEIILELFIKLGHRFLNELNGKNIVGLDVIVKNKTKISHFLQINKP